MYTRKEAVGPKKELRVGCIEFDLPAESPCGSSRQLDTRVQFYGKIKSDSSHVVAVALP